LLKKIFIAYLYRPIYIQVYIIEHKIFLMLKKILFHSFVLFTAVGSAFAQVGQGSIKGKVTDKDTKEPLPFVNIILELNGTQVAGGATNFDGEYFIKPIPPGKYDLKATFTGYQPMQISGVIISAEKITFQNIVMPSTVIEMKAFEVVQYTVPLIDKDQTASGATITREDIDKLPGRSATSVAEMVGGVYSKDDGSGDLNIRGSRSDANYYFIDGVKVRGSNSLPKAAIEQVTVVTGGVPAQYGDITGGVISITTRGPSSNYFGSLDYSTSGYRFGGPGGNVYGLDAYGFNLLEFSLAGPLLSKKDTSGAKTGKPLLGFFLSGNFNSDVDPTPSSIGYWKVKDDKLDELNADPLRQNPNGPGTFLNHEFLRLNDLEKVRTQVNAGRYGYNLTSKIDVATSSNTNLTFGGTYDYNKSNSSLYSYSLMNWGNNPVQTENTWRVYGRFTQRFGSTDQSQEEKSASLIKNAYYSIQADYSKFKQTIWDGSHKDNLFSYGHIGEFKTYSQRFYQPGFHPEYGPALIQQTYEDTLIGFRPGTANPEGAAFTNSYYTLNGWQGYDENGNPVYDYEKAEDKFRNLNNIRQNGGMFNGDFPRDVYGMWRSPAYQYNQYSLRNNSQFRITAVGSADIKNHAIMMGFEYEQRVDRGFTVSPVGLWSLGRLYTNSHILNLDTENPDVQWFSSFPIISYDRLNASPGDYKGQVQGESQYFFDYNLRKSLGLNPDGTDWIDFDSYSPETFNLNFFNADELLNNGNALVSYWGYDHTGNRLKKDPTFDDFFNGRDEYGNFTRNIQAYRPIYTSAFIQDKFAFDDLVFNIGLRVDRFDANQQVLKDPYVFFPTVKAGEKEALDLTETGQHPGTIGNDYVVYVDNVSSPTAITGYRNGDTWYNAEGTEISDPSVLVGPTGISPLLVDKENVNGLNIRSTSFEDYKPQTNFMPRVAFSFPISDEALFFAHYDVLTKRPTSGARLDPTDYFFIENVNNEINNPNLRPEKTIDYEVGFQQKLNGFSSLKIAAFYRELRDLVQIVNLVGTYPARNYRTYGNIDFGTVKGMTFSYDLRRFGNVRMLMSYTLQFAEGTGSDATSALNLARSGKQNLRTTIPLSYDQRHTITGNIDYRYGAGKNYNGPEIFGKRIFENTGANFVINAGSGVPYSRQSNVTPDGLFSGGAAVLKGSINGARLPWQFRADARIDKDFELSWGKTEDGNKKKTAGLNVYFQILNLFNAQNIISVYRATGNADDDGYLAAAQYQKEIQSQNDVQSYSELYRLKVNNPLNYSLPRRIRIGVLFNF
jgi:hypothetical protein